MKERISVYSGIEWAIGEVKDLQENKGREQYYRKVTSIWNENQ